MGCGKNAAGSNVEARFGAASLIDLRQHQCQQAPGITKGGFSMIRKFGIAAALGLSLAMPAHEAMAQNTLGGALLGGAAGAVVGGAVGGGRGAAIGAVIGAGTGAAIASEGDRRRGGYYWYHGGCYIQNPDGWIRVDRGYCY
jgi:YMGG-like Gly-zipper